MNGDTRTTQPHQCYTQHSKTQHNDASEIPEKETIYN